MLDPSSSEEDESHSGFSSSRRAVQRGAHSVRLSDDRCAEKYIQLNQSQSYKSNARIGGGNVGSDGMNDIALRPAHHKQHSFDSHDQANMDSKVHGYHRDKNTYSKEKSGQSVTHCLPRSDTSYSQHRQASEHIHPDSRNLGRYRSIEDPYIEQTSQLSSLPRGRTSYETTNWSSGGSVGGYDYHDGLDIRNTGREYAHGGVPRQTISGQRFPQEAGAQASYQ
ncbi:unnamed protein product [Protopolystoma xenopodis]|uniref:Uncharacterized protein n=1 Tax=Protopolystoma xenopodis TaxID=117903 RepID=A0A448XD28_9PLAT|nr:unnamed protein product [Protopolystoma xenopodis]